MNIEPAMLLMVHSIPRYASMTNTLLEFLIMAKDHYNPARRALTQRGFEKGISALVQRGVVSHPVHRTHPNYKWSLREIVYA